MLNEYPSALKRVVTSLKVVALATVLGTVVLAAEREMTAQVSPQEIVVTDMAVAPDAVPANVVPASPSAPATPVQQAPADYFPSHFPAPGGEPAAPAPTF